MCIPLIWGGRRVPVLGSETMRNLIIALPQGQHPDHDLCPHSPQCGHTLTHSEGIEFAYLECRCRLRAGLSKQHKPQQGNELCRPRFRGGKSTQWNSWGTTQKLFYLRKKNRPMPQLLLIESMHWFPNKTKTRPLFVMKNF